MWGSLAKRPVKISVQIVNLTHSQLRQSALDARGVEHEFDYCINTCTTTTCSLSILRYKKNWDDARFSVEYVMDDDVQDKLVLTVEQDIEYVCICI